MQLQILSFEISITVYLKNAWCQTANSLVKQDDSVGDISNGLLAELPTIFDRFSPQVIT